MTHRRRAVVILRFGPTSSSNPTSSVAGITLHGGQTVAFLVQVESEGDVAMNAFAITTRTFDLTCPVT